MKTYIAHVTNHDDGRGRSSQQKYTVLLSINCPYPLEDSSFSRG